MSEGLAFIANGSFSLVSFIVALSIIVFIHEFGHYIVGRWCGIDAEVFSIGFGPVLLSRKDKHGTMWQIALLPLGGFVKFSREETNCQATKENFVNFERKIQVNWLYNFHHHLLRYEELLLNLAHSIKDCLLLLVQA